MKWNEMKWNKDCENKETAPSYEEDSVFFFSDSLVSDWEIIMP